MRIVRLVLTVSIVLLGMGLTSASAQTKDAMEKLAADWAATFHKADAKALAGFYTDAAVRITPQGGTVVGRAAIEKEFATNFTGPWKGATIKITVGKVESLGPDTGLAEGTYEVMGVKLPDGKPAPAIKGSYLNTVVKKSGAWMLASNAAVEPPPPAK
jgi:uncharacterized protein (TIGR02246 family)